MTKICNKSVSCMTSAGADLCQYLPVLLMKLLHKLEAIATDKDGGLPTVCVTCSSFKLLSCKICHDPYVWKKPFHACRQAWTRTVRERSRGMQLKMNFTVSACQ